KAPLGVLVGPGGGFAWGADRRPRHSSDTVIYELHVGGFTRSPSSGVAQDRRGTYRGLIDKIPYLKDLGVTAVELMPVFQFDPQEGNFWGYMPLSFFAPHHGYGRRPQDCGQLEEFREMVKALHAADIEVILDVVYNHTAEADEHGPLYSYKGIDNSTYYILTGG
ncbi:glycogen debranching enzyme GlgX, partial [mine drainage metagenome]